MNYEYRVDIRDNAILRASFNELTRKTFGFDFISWYDQEHWGDNYIPHALVDHSGKVISNVSVNLMKFDVSGETKHYIQLGTVMTDPDYQGQGLNKYLIHRILEEYQETVDGFYLFANDSVLNYYPKYGFKPVKEYEYSLLVEGKAMEKAGKYSIEKVSLSDQKACDKLYQTIQFTDQENLGHNPNDRFALYDNLSLIQFWLTAEYEDNVYYIPELKAYIIAHIETDVLTVVQIFSQKKVDMVKLAASFGEEISKVKLCYTPKEKEVYHVKPHKIENSTLFILGEDLYQMEIKKMMFPEISHA